jgi:predicted peptidase
MHPMFALSPPAVTTLFGPTLLFLLPALARATSRTETGFLDRTTAAGGRQYRYQVFVPRGHRRRKTWPVILFLHGSGERGMDGLRQTSVGLPAAIRRDRQRFPFVVVLPQCRAENWLGEMGRMALAALDSAIREFRGDPARIYLTGLSLGGGGAWYIAATHSGKFAAVVPVCGKLDMRTRRDRTKPAPRIAALLSAPDPYRALAERLGKTPVWAFHGDADDAVPVAESRRMVGAMTLAGGDVRYTEYEGVGHDSWDRAYAEPDLVPWLLSHSLSLRERAG